MFQITVLGVAANKIVVWWISLQCEITYHRKSKYLRLFIYWHLQDWYTVCVTAASSVDEHVNVMLLVTCSGAHVACNDNLTEYALSKSKVKVTVANTHILVQYQNLTCCKLIHNLKITNTVYWFEPLLYSIYWLLHVSAVACHHQGAS
jgi:hypothetical protein